MGDASSIRITGGGEAANLGTALHAVQAGAIKGEPVDLLDVAAEYDVDHDELQRLAIWAWRAWQGLAEWFPDPQTEVSISGTDEEYGIELTGHADVLSVDHERRRLAICDWKSGWLDHDYTAQLRGYALLALLHYPDIMHVYLVSCRIRDQTYSGEMLTRKQIEDWWDQFAGRLNEGGYNPGRHCGHCPVRLGCPAREKHLAESVEWMGITDGDLGELLDRAKALEFAAGAVKDQIRAEVIAAGGRWKCGDGRELVITEQPRRSIDFAAGWPVIQAALPDADLAGAVTISKSKVEAAAKEAAGRGRKGKAVQELLDRLDVAGAMRTTFIQRLEVRRTNDGNGSDTGGVKAITAAGDDGLPGAGAGD